MDLDYRLARHDDLEGLRVIWEEAGWGTISDEQWRAWYGAVERGHGLHVLAVERETGRVVGTFGFVASKVWVDGKEVRAFRPAAPIVARDVKVPSINPAHHPSVRMYAHGVRELTARGDGILYIVPNPGWIPFLKLVKGFKLGSFPLWMLPLPLAEPLPVGGDYAVSRVDAYDPRVDALWEKSAALYGCQVVRTAQTLTLKASPAHYEILCVERGGELVGLSTSRAQGDRQWVICDLLVADHEDSLRATLAATCNLAHEQARKATPEKPILKTAILVTPAMEAVVRDLGFTRDKYDFPIGVQTLSAHLSGDSVAPERWYLSAND